MRNRLVNIGDKAICSESGVVGTVIRFYTPTSCEEQTLVKTKDNKQYHAPTRTWILYKDGYRTNSMIIDDFNGRYGLAMSTDYCKTLSENLSRQICKSYKGVV